MTPSSIYLSYSNSTSKYWSLKSNDSLMLIFGKKTRGCQNSIRRKMQKAMPLCWTSIIHSFDDTIELYHVFSSSRVSRYSQLFLLKRIAEEWVEKFSERQKTSIAGYFACSLGRTYLRGLGWCSSAEKNPKPLIIELNNINRIHQTLVGVRNIGWRRKLWYKRYSIARNTILYFFSILKKRYDWWWREILEADTRTRAIDREKLWS